MKPWSVSPFWFKCLTVILRTGVINEHHFTWAHSNWLRSSKRQQIFAALIFLYLKCNETSTVQLVKRGHRTLRCLRMRDYNVWVCRRGSRGASKITILSPISKNILASNHLVSGFSLLFYLFPLFKIKTFFSIRFWIKCNHKSIHIFSIAKDWHTVLTK